MEEKVLSEPNQLAQAQRLAAITNPPAPSDGGDAPAALCSSSFSSDDDDQGEEDEFEFPFVSRDSPAGTAAPADELFADGRIRPAAAFRYPVFGFGHVGSTTAHTVAPSLEPPPPRVRGQLGRLFLEESRARNGSTSSTASSASTTSSSDDVLDGASPESYCLWTPGGGSSSPRLPPPRPPRKSSSTGSVARWRRISDLVVGRSRSDGKDKLMMFFPVPLPNKPKPKESVVNTNKHRDKPSPAVRKKQDPAEVDMVAAAHRMAYGSGGGVLGGTPRRTFLPYREELVGFFANVNGVNRSHQHPF